jgi:seryl-tRNA synthetase
MFIARNATRTLKRNPRSTNLTTSRTFHTSLTNLNKMSEETKQQIKTAFPELLNIAKQKTTLPGREKDMTPIAKHTELECVASFANQPVVRRGVGTLNETFFLHLSCM